MFIEDKPYFSIETLLGSIEGPNQEGCLRMLRDNRALFQTVQGSTHNHQNWLGGYFDHIQEGLNIAFKLYMELSGLRPLPFTLGDLTLVFYLHDCEKPWKYELGDDGQWRHKPEFKTKADDHAFRTKKIAEYGIVLTPYQQNGLKYVEGEMGDYSPRGRVMNELAGVAHCCDVLSARVWYAHPFVENDPWIGASRVRDVVS